MTNRKALIICHMGQMIAQFNRENISILIEMGYEVHLAANFTSPRNTMNQKALEEFCGEMESIHVSVHQVDFERGVGSLASNMIVWKELKTIFEGENFSLVHCQSPLGGVFGRILAHKYSVPVIYTAHGFHFFRGGPIHNWLFYYPVERFLSRYTDCLITINHADYDLAIHFHAKDVRLISGVGIDVAKFRSTQPNKLTRKQLGVPKDAFVIVSCGELSANKNEQVIIRAISQLHDKDIFYFLIGQGQKRKELESLAQHLNLERNVVFMGYQNNPEMFYSISDIAAFPSRREGLGLAGIEEMAAGLPLITSNAGGISEYSVDGLTGFVSGPDDYLGFAKSIRMLKENQKLRIKISEHNKKSVDMFSVDEVNKQMRSIYQSVIRG